jgi:two-component system CheB/CheR fusion protein
MLNDQNTLNKIFVLLRAQSGHDFSQYKLNTIYRRIERRMSMHQLKTLIEYVKFLQQTPTEVMALFQDLLIGVTQFFRDTDAFIYLKNEILPKLFTDKQPTDVIRLWSVGCSSGEEAYSLAILLKEYMEETKKNINIQIFATDIDARAIAIARAGSYPESISTTISAERLARFFISEGNGHYRIHKSIRDMLIFSEQNVIKDPPFSKLDLISCRNLLIYMNAELQKKLIPLFHYALNPNGFLFLGSSENIGEFNELFSLLSPTLKFFQRKEAVTGIQRRVPLKTSRPEKW